jgi:hypothetical protein
MCYGNHNTPVHCSFEIAPRHVVAETEVIQSCTLLQNSYKLFGPTFSISFPMVQSDGVCLGVIRTHHKDETWSIRSLTDPSQILQKDTVTEQLTDRCSNLLDS